MLWQSKDIVTIVKSYKIGAFSHLIFQSYYWHYICIKAEHELSRHQNNVKMAPKLLLKFTFQSKNN